MYICILWHKMIVPLTMQFSNVLSYSLNDKKHESYIKSVGSKFTGSLFRKHWHIRFVMSLPREDIDLILKSHLGSHDYEFISCEKSNVEDVSIGFLSAQGKMSINYKIRGREKELHIFIKKLPESLYHRQVILSLGGFHREVILFNKLFNSFHEYFQDNTIPKCYLARSDEILVLEDLSCKGFKNTNLYEPLDLVHCKKTLEAIAKFHSASFITEKKEEQRIVDLVPMIKNEVMMSADDNHVGRKAFLAGIVALKKVTEIYLAHYPTDLINRAFDYMEHLFEKMKSSELYPNAISHSDLWINNVMFKYDASGKVKEACLVDFQLASYKAPSYDIQLFLHTCTVRELRDKHYNELLKHYFNALETQLSLARISMQGFMTWHDFENMLKETLPVVITIAPLFLHFVLMPADIVKDVMGSDIKYKVYYEEDRTDHILRAMQENEFYKQRILQAMTEFLNYFHSN